MAGVQRGGRGEVECEREARSLGGRGEVECEREARSLGGRGEVECEREARSLGGRGEVECEREARSLGARRERNIVGYERPTIALRARIQLPPSLPFVRRPRRLSIFDSLDFSNEQLESESLTVVSRDLHLRAHFQFTFQVLSLCLLQPDKSCLGLTEGFYRDCCNQGL